MFWGKKDEKKSLPELPPLKPSFLMNQEPKGKIEGRSMPSFPDSSMNKEFSQEEIKESVEGDELPEISSKQKMPVPKVREFDELPMRKIMPGASPAAKTEDVYVKIERFHSARKALNNARNKLAEIDELMKKIRETKMREEQELSSWEEEIESVKEKVEEVTNNIFEKVE